MPLSKNKLRKLLREWPAPEEEKVGKWVKMAKVGVEEEYPEWAKGEAETVSETDYLKELQRITGEEIEEKRVEDIKEKIGGVKKTKSKKPESKKPVVIEFPKVTEEIKREEETEGAQKVRGMPFKEHKLPKEEKRRVIPSQWKPPELKTIDVRYPLIEPYAYAVIKWNEKAHELNYYVLEPPLTKEEAENLTRIKDLVIDLLDINLMEIKDPSKVKGYLKDKLDQIISDYDIRLTEVTYNKILYYVYRDFLGLEKIEPLMQDENIEDISCDGVNIPIYVFHRKYGSLKTNIMFTDPDELNSFTIKLAQRCGKHISIAEPLMNGALPDGSRVQATFSAGGDIAMRGSTFTIRKFTKDPLTVVDLMNYGTLPATIGAYLWLSIEFRNSILVSGGTATGKTSLLNALCLFLHPETKIVSIEDTPELRLPHEHWIAKVARPGYGPTERGSVSMFDLLRAALRERPEEIIVGEVRGKEAYVLFQGMATGHPGMATLHAESFEAVVNRLITPPINLSPGLLQHLDIIIILQHSRIKGVDVRRIKSLIEVVGVDFKTGKLITNTLFKWVPSKDYYEFSSDQSHVINSIIEEKGIPEKSVWEELKRREDILNWMRKKGIRHYKEVGNIVARYYKDPISVLEEVYGGKLKK